MIITCALKIIVMLNLDVFMLQLIVTMELVVLLILATLVMDNVNIKKNIPNVFLKKNVLLDSVLINDVFSTKMQNAKSTTVMIFAKQNVLQRMHVKLLAATAIKTFLYVVLLKQKFVMTEKNVLQILVILKQENVFINKSNLDNVTVNLVAQTKNVLYGHYKRKYTKPAKLQFVMQN
jgi:hypothetical protein